MQDCSEKSENLTRKLSNRHIQLIALGGTIGTELFLSSAGVLELAGPSMVLGYAVAGFVTFLIMRFPGEMLVEDPVSSSFNRRGLPTAAILLPTAFTALCGFLNYVLPNGGIELLISRIVACLIFSWTVIIVTHLKFHHEMRLLGKTTRFKAHAIPESNYFWLAFLAFLVVIRLLTSSIHVSAYAMPAWLAIVLRRLSSDGPLS